MTAALFMVSEPAAGQTKTLLGDVPDAQPVFLSYDLEGESAGNMVAQEKP
jgi:hypothetical protein